MGYTLCVLYSARLVALFCYYFMPYHLNPFGMYNEGWCDKVQNKFTWTSPSANDVTIFASYDNDIWAGAPDLDYFSNFSVSFSSFSEWSRTRCFAIVSAKKRAKHTFPIAIIVSIDQRKKKFIRSHPLMQVFFWHIQTWGVLGEISFWSLQNSQLKIKQYVREIRQTIQH